jgi:hypothetical protein
VKWDEFRLLIEVFIVVENLLDLSVSYVGLRKASTQPTSDRTEGGK